MKFKDLPSIKKIGKLYDSFYEVNSSGLIYLYHSDESIYSEHGCVMNAYQYLERNPELEVSDTFFGNNFPFLSGGGVRMESDSKMEYVVISHLSILQFIPKIELDFFSTNAQFGWKFNFSLDFEENYKNFVDSKKRGLFISSIGGHYFATKTHSELCDLVHIAQIMAL